MLLILNFILNISYSFVLTMHFQNLEFQMHLKLYTARALRKIYCTVHCPKSNIVKRNVYLYSKKCLSGTEEMFLYCKSPC